MGVAPENTVAVFGGHENGIADAADGPVGAAHRHMIGAGFADRRCVMGDGTAALDVGPGLSVELHRPVRDRAGGAVVKTILSAHAQHEVFARAHDARCESGHRGDRLALDDNGLDGQTDEAGVVLESDVQGQRHAVAGECRCQNTL